MCGICGIISTEGEVSNEIVRKMNNSMSHRGPDDDNIYINNDHTAGIFVGLGHRRLSIIDLSSAGRQPISNEDRTIWLTFNGEIYNFKELKKGLQNRGHVFLSHTDGEVIVHLYEDYGEECLQSLCGMFAFAIWDENKKRLFVARDRTGKKPLVYYCKNNHFVFASEFNTLLTSGLIRKEVNYEGIDEYLSLGYISAPTTGYKDIFKLPPAHFMFFQNGKTETHRYWSLNYVNKVSGSFNDVSEELLSLLTNAVRQRMLSDVPLGSFLSGGIDSSVVVALMAQLSWEKIKTFSIGFEEGQYNELGYARKVAECFNTEHYEFIVKPDALEVLPLLVERYGEPFADSSSIPTYYVSKLTKSHVTVALSGDGGDELFAGYERYSAMRLADYYCRIPKFIRKHLLSRILQKIPDSIDPKNRYRRVRRFFEAAELPFAERYLRWIGIFNSGLKNEIYSSDMKNRLESKNALSGFFSYFQNSNDINSLDKLLMVDTNVYLPFDLLVKVDISSMANSLEVRSPFLDHKLIEFVASLPPSYKLKGMTSKYILKKLFKGILPAGNINRRKMGFGVPVRLWFMNELKDFLRDILLSSDSLNRGYFNPEVVNRMVDSHVSGKADYSMQLWSLLMLELWHKRFIDY